MQRSRVQAAVRSLPKNAIACACAEALEGRTLFVALNSAQTISGSIGAAGEIDTYTISGIAGGSFLATVAETVSGSSLTPRIEVRKPDNTVLTFNQNAKGTTLGSIALPTTGTYTITIKDYVGTGTGGYILTAVSIGPGIVQNAGGDAGATTSAETKSASIGVGDIDVFTLSGVAGGSFLAAVGETVAGSTLTPQIAVYSPTGALLSFNQNAVGTILGNLSTATTGTYTVIVRDYTGIGVGAYNMTAVMIAPGISQNAGGDAGAATSAATRTASIGVGDIDVFTLNGVAGGSFLAAVGETTAGSTLTPQIAVYSPAGALLSFNQNAVGTNLGTLATATTGTYTVIVRDYTGTGTGGYAMTPVTIGTGLTQNAGGDAGAANSAETRTASIGVGDIDVFTLSGVAGGAFLAAVQETTAGSALTPQIAVYSPTGALLSFNQNAAGINLGSLATATTGIYTVIVRDYTGTAAGGYAVTPVLLGAGIAQNSGGDGGFIASGVQKSPTIALGDIDIHPFYAVTGDKLVMTVTETVAGSTLTPQIALFSPAGALLTFNQNASTIGLTVNSAASTGLYFLMVRDYVGTGTGGYKLNLTQTPSATKPTISIAATDPLATEPGSDKGTFTVTRTNLRALPVTVFYTAAGTATKGTDYVTLSGSVVIQPNLASATIDVTALTDTLTEGAETVIVTLSTNAAYNLAAAKTATVTIAPSGTGKISGTVYDDTNASGTIDSGEPGMASRRVFVDLDNDNAWDNNERSTLTTATGTYEFANLPTGTFRVRQVVPAGTRATLPASIYYDVTLAAAQVVTGRHFATTTKALFSGTVFKDANSNKLKDAGEAGLSGWRVFIDADNDLVWDATETSVLTDATGAFKFNNLAAGTVKFAVVAQAGWSRTTPTALPLVLTLSAGQAKTDGLFGYTQVV